MKEVIEKIEEVYNHKLNYHEVIGKEVRNRTESVDGFIVTTNKQKICVGIDNYGQCCESWGQIVMNDNLEDFIGSELLKFETVDDAFDKTKLEDIDVEDGEFTFVNFETSKGTLQLTVYDSHNGYYGHQVFIKSEPLT